MKRKHFFLTEKQIQKLETLAEETGLSVAELIRRAIDDYLSK